MKPEPKSLWRHKKRGTTYAVLAVGIFQVTAGSSGDTSLDMAEVVIYLDDEERFWVRPLDEFMDGRFELLQGGTP